MMIFVGSTYLRLDCMKGLEGESELTLDLMMLKRIGPSVLDQTNLGLDDVEEDWSSSLGSD